MFFALCQMMVSLTLLSAREAQANGLEIKA